MNLPRVVIVGAGLAGLSAAEYLTKSGNFDVTLVEARTRTGGRIHSAQFGHDSSCIVEVGANWIHGATDENCVYSLANQLNMLEPLVMLDRMEGHCYRSDGTRIASELTNKMWDKFQAWEAKANTAPPNVKLEDFYHSQMSQFISGLPLSQHHDAYCIFNCLLNYSRFHEAGFINMKSAHEGEQGFKELPGGDVKVPGGIGSMVRHLTEDLPEDKIIFRFEVKKIIWGENENVAKEALGEADREATAKGKGESMGKWKVEKSQKGRFREWVKVVSTDGRVIEADHVIVTIPLGCLKKKHNTLFQPSLPKEKVYGIENIGFGRVNKIFLYYEKPFWKAGEGGVKLGWSIKERHVESKKEWFKRIFAFDEVLNNRHVLVAWISGNEAEYVEHLPQEEIIDSCTWVLQKFLGRNDLPKPSRMLHSSWCSDQFSQGAYSYWGLNTKERDFIRLSQPVYQYGVPAILFAGESTVSNAYSTLHGARASGLREAKRLISLYKSPNSK